MILRWWWHHNLILLLSKVNIYWIQDKQTLYFNFFKQTHDIIITIIIDIANVGVLRAVHACSAIQPITLGSFRNVQYCIIIISLLLNHISSMQGLEIAEITLWICLFPDNLILLIFYACKCILRWSSPTNRRVVSLLWTIRLAKWS